jgi:hypothetical protein
LAITDRAVRLHGGTVRASNRAEGGLQIEIRLPIAPVDDNVTSVALEAKIDPDVAGEIRSVAVPAETTSSPSR